MMSRTRLHIILLVFTLGAGLIAGCQGNASKGLLGSDPKRIVLAPDASPITGERRVALVIGNAKYSGEGVRPLKNPENDAQAVGATLKRLGFSTTVLLDADRDTIRDGVETFARDIARDGPRTVALLYYSGHGMQVSGNNYLIPVSFTRLPDPENIDDYAYPVNRALDEMKGAGARANVVILDACRDNPYDTHKSLAGKGLAKMEPQGVYIAYATADGETAEDNPNGANGLYTQELLKALAVPGQNIHQVFMMVRQGVYSASSGSQYPYDYDGLLSDNFYFAGAPSAPEPMVASKPVAALKPPTGVRPAALMTPPPAPRPSIVTKPSIVVPPPSTLPHPASRVYKLARILKGHHSGVESVCYSSDSKCLASASDDKTVKLWDANTGQCLKTLAGHTGIVKSICYSSDSKCLASASDDKTIRIWNADSGQCIRTLAGHADSVNFVCFSPDSKCLASASDDNTVKLWDANTGQCLKTFTGHTDCVFSVCYSADGKRIASASRDYTVRIWDVDSGQCLKTLAGHTGIVNSVCYSPDSKCLASASADHTVRIWDAASGQCLQTLPLANDETFVSFSPDGKHLVLGSLDGQVRIYDAAL